MRRNLFRVCALGAVAFLVLGIIAIAQAQRGDNEPTQGSPASGGGGKEAGVESAGTGPRLLPASTNVNPLRPGRSDFPADAVQAAAATTDAPGPGSNVLRPALLPAPQTPAPSAKPPVGDQAPSPESDGLVATDLAPSAAAKPAAPAKLVPPVRAPAGLVLEPPAERPVAVPAPAPRSATPSRLGPVADDAGRARAALLPVESARGESVQGESTRAESARSTEGTGRPGSPELEGPQSPQLTIQKTAPAEVQAGKPASFQVRLRNTGPVSALGVELRDEVPKGARLIATTPPASRGVRGELVWAFGTIEPGKEVSVEVQWMPLEEGHIGSKARVSFQAEASAKTLVTRPRLVVKAASAKRAMLGEEVVLGITVSNPGTGVAQNVVIEAHLPLGMRHPGGSELDYPVGDLKPNESRHVELKLTAVQPGPMAGAVSARGEGNLKAEDRLDLEVLAPRLDLAMEGPKRRFLEREAVYVVSISNPGTAPARQVELVAELPPGLKFVAANNSGQYEDATRTVHWLLEELPTKETGSVELTTVPVEPGEQKLRIRGSAEKGLAIHKEHPVIIEGIAAPQFEVTDTNDPISVNGETTYQIRVLNQGSKAATNVRITAQLPAELKAIAAEGPVRHAIEPSRVVFDPLPILAPKASTTYRVRVLGLKPGDQRVRVQLLTDEIRVPLTKEESTRVFSDD